MIAFPLTPEWLARQQRVHDQKVRVGKFAPYVDRPDAFFEDVLGATLWPKQRELIELVRTNIRVACRAGQKVSKTFSAVGLGIWWAATRPGPKTKVFFTAPTMHQVKNILWNELEALWPRVADDLGGEIPKDPRAGITLTSGARIVGITTRKPEALQGISGEEVLFIIDEASGYPDELYQAVRGNTAGGDEDGGAKIVALSNPTKPSGWFFNAFYGKGRWALHHISSEDSPNVRAGKRLIKGLATRAYIEEQRQDCGTNYREHPVYQVRVLGNFPTSASNQAVSLGAVEAAIERRKLGATIENAFGGLVLGIDPAWYGGDDAVVFPVRGWCAGDPVVIGGVQTGPQIARAALDLATELRRPAERTVTIVVDGISAGQSTVDALNASDEVRSGRVVVVVHRGNDAAHQGHKYINRRSEVWFNLARWCDEGGAIPDLADLRRELLAPTYSFDPESRFVLETKRALVKRLGKSPNLADALTLAVSTVQPPEPDYLSSLPEDDEDDW